MHSIHTRAQIVVADLLEIPRKEIEPEKNLYDDLGMDSLDLIELAMDLEDEFGVEVSDAEARQFQTFGDISNLIDTKLR